MKDQPNITVLFKLAPAEAVAYLQGRGLLTPTFSWQDLWQDEHAHAFTVSRLARPDILESLRDGITRSVEGDLSRRDWTRNARELLQKEGWWGKKTVREPSPSGRGQGEGGGELLTTTFNPARLKLIFDTNTRMAAAAGQWQRIARNKSTHPYIRYITQRDEKVRHAHRAWDNLTLPVDHPFWKTHFPPNGWRCRCRVVSMSQREYDAGLSPNGQTLNKTAPEIKMRDWTNKRTGEVSRVPEGIDPGFAYNPGLAAARQSNMAQVAAAKLAQVTPDLAAAYRQASMIDYARAARDADGLARHLIVGAVESAQRIERATGFDLAGYNQILDASKVKHIFDGHGDDLTESRRAQRAVTVYDIALIPALVNNYDDVSVSGSKTKGGLDALIFVKRFGREVFYYAAEIRKGKKHLAPATLYIKIGTRGR